MRKNKKIRKCWECGEEIVGWFKTTNPDLIGPNGEPEVEWIGVDASGHAHVDVCKKRGDAPGKEPRYEQVAVAIE